MQLDQYDKEMQRSRGSGPPHQHLSFVEFYKTFCCKFMFNKIHFCPLPFAKQQAQSAGCPPLCMSYSVALNNWLKRNDPVTLMYGKDQRSNLRSPNEPPYVIFYRLLIHMEALGVISDTG